MEHLNIDRDYLKTKLKDYQKVSHKTLKKGHHFRYCKNKYKEKGRDCAYGVIQKLNEDGSFLVNGYTPGNEKPQFPDWKIEPLHKFKVFTFYRRKEDIEKESLYRE